MKRIVSIFCIVLVIISFFACKPSVPDSNPDSDELPAKDISIILNEATKQYTVIRAEKADEDIALAASELWKFFFDMKPGEIKSDNDWVQKGMSTDNDNYEILVGMTNRPESSNASKIIKTYLDYCIVVVDNKICIYANTAERLLDAVEYFKSKISFENGVITFNGIDRYVDTYEEYIMPNMSICGTPISEYTIVISADASNSEKEFAAEYAEYIALNSGVIIDIVDDTTAAVEREILIGKTNRAESDVEIINGARITVVNNKLVVTTKNDAYLDIISGYFYKLMTEKSGSLAEDTNIYPDNTAEELFLAENYAAGLINEDVNYGVLALLSSLEYFNDRMVYGTKNLDERWVYSNKGANVKQTGYFDDMLLTDKKGANCASPVNWALTEMGIVPHNDRFYGGGVGEFKSYSGKAESYLAPYCEYFDFHSDPIPFHQLYKEGKVKAGDIFLCKHHTFVYRGEQTFYAAGHDGAWHTEEDAPTEDAQKAVFDNWVLAFDEASGSGKKGSYNSNYNYDIHYIVRIKDTYIPKYFRNKEGKLISNPMYIED